MSVLIKDFLLGVVLVCLLMAFTSLAQAAACVPKQRIMLPETALIATDSNRPQAGTAINHR